MSRQRFLAGLFCGLVSAGLSTWLTDDPALCAIVGIIVCAFVWIFGGLLLAVIGDD